jgi:Fic family protein
MSSEFCPRFRITPALAKDLMRIEAIRQKAAFLPKNRKALWKKTLAELTTYFRFIEDPENKKEIKGYLMALRQVRSWVSKKDPLSVKQIQILHACLLPEEQKGKLTPLRDGRNAIFNWNMKKILYFPPKAEDVPGLMKQLVSWITKAKDLPCPLVAGIAHFGLNSIHPFYDGNGRTARLLTRWVLARGGYDLGGLFCLEREYAEDLLFYYDSLSLQDAKSYYQRVAKRDMTSWLEYFCHTMVRAFERSLRRIHTFDT